MNTKIILIILFLITCIYHYFKNKPKKEITNKLTTYFIASVPVVIYVIFGGNPWFYSFIGMIVWVLGFYFGEIFMWWSIWILTIGSTYWYFGVIGPIIITLLPYFYISNKRKR